MLDLLLCLGKNGKQLEHYLCDNLRHQSSQKHPRIDFEAFEEASDTFKEFEESVIACADPFCRLLQSGIRGISSAERSEGHAGRREHRCQRI
jgi:hypothetical protein